MSYVSVVVDYFTTRRGSEPIVSAGDYATIAEWEKQEIPLAFVLGSLDRILNELAARHIKVASISELHSAVNMEFADWLRTRGKRRRT